MRPQVRLQAAVHQAATQISATDRAFASVSCQPGRSGCTRVTNSSTASTPDRGSGDGSSSRSGVASGATSNCCSLGVPSGARLVTTTRSSGQLASRSSTSAPSRARPQSCRAPGARADPAMPA